MRLAPQAFDWLGGGPVGLSGRLRRWRVPEDLLSLWAQTGGGDMFETEELLSPTASEHHDLEAVNHKLWSAGLPSELLVFHIGLFWTAIDGAQRVIKVDPDHLAPVASFESLSDWYLDLRSEYARKYGLPGR
jgi:hypothetical protein